MDSADNKGKCWTCQCSPCQCHAQIARRVIPPKPGTAYSVIESDVSGDDPLDMAFTADDLDRAKSVMGNIGDLRNDQLDAAFAELQQQVNKETAVQRHTRRTIDH